MAEFYTKYPGVGEPTSTGVLIEVERSLPARIVDGYFALLVAIQVELAAIEDDFYGGQCDTPSQGNDLIAL